MREDLEREYQEHFRHLEKAKRILDDLILRYYNPATVEFRIDTDEEYAARLEKMWKYIPDLTEAREAAIRETPRMRLKADIEEYMQAELARLEKKK